MGIFDFLFGKPERQTSSTITTQQLPEEIRPGAKKVVDEAMKLYDQRTKRGRAKFGVTRVPDPNDPSKTIEVGTERSTIADLTPDEIEARKGLKSLIGVQDPYIDEYEKGISDYASRIEDIPIEFTAEAAEKFASPYLDAVLEVEKRKVQEDFERKVLPKFEKQAVEAGGMSGLGSRAGVTAALLGDTFSRQLGDIEAIGRQKAFEDAYSKFKEEGSRKRTVAGDLLDSAGLARDIGKTKLDTGLADFGLLKKLGEEDREFKQAKLGEEYARFLEEEEFVPSELTRLSGFITGSPFTKALSKSEVKTQASATPQQQIFGLGLQGLRGSQSGQSGFGKGFFRSAEGGKVNRNMGGGLTSALPLVKRSMAGAVGTSVTPATKLGNQLLQQATAGLNLSSDALDYLKTKRDIKRNQLEGQKQIAKDTISRFRKSSTKAFNELVKRDKDFLSDLGEINKDTLKIVDPEAAKKIINPRDAGITAAQDAVLDEDAGRFGAVGLLALTMSKYSEGKSKADKEQYNLIKEAALKTASIKRDELKAQDLRQKGQNDKASEIEKEINKQKTALETIKNNIPTAEAASIDASVNAQLDKTKKLAEIEAKRAKAAKDRNEKKLTSEKITTQMNAIGKSVERSLKTALGGNVSVGPDGSVRIKSSFYGKDKKLQNKINNALTKANEDALREIGKKDPNIIASDLSAKIRKILGITERPKI